MPSTARPGKSKDEVECDLMFYKREHEVLHIIGCFSRCGAGIEIPDKTMTSILDAYHQCWIQVGPAEVFYSDGKGALNNDTCKGSP
eukprot:3680220-Pyramimonas_sp.AAC.1